MITAILLASLISVWCIGAIFVTVITGWEMNKIYDLIKIVFWPITVFICNK